MHRLFTVLAALLSGCVITTTPIPSTVHGYPDPGGVSEDVFPPGSGQYPGGIRPQPAAWGLVAPGVPFNAASFADFNTGWVVGAVDFDTRKAIIRHTRNAGASWEVQDKGINDLRTVQFLTPNVGYASGDNGVLFRTENAGSSWKLVDSGTTEQIVDISFLNLTDGLFLTRNAGLFQTTDGGATWVKRNVVPDGRDVEYLPNGVAYVAGGNGFYRFERGVLTKLEFPSDRPGAFAFVDPARRLGWAVGPFGSLYRSEDAGTSWEQVRRLTTPDEYVSRYSATALAFSSATTGMLLTERAMYQTYDGGKVWERGDSRLTFTKCGKYFKLFDADHGWAYGDGISLYRYGN
ncbi:MAG: hypothetical protein FJZ01_08705 [Candidatus Sericytochromatia bacterium]|nr:hypothetical protein [Candidatus Tanganyikabacteria bacterium]